MTGVEVTGLIDFGAVGLDSPAADLARLLGSLAPDQVERWEVAWDAYRQIAPLSPAEQRLSLLLDKTGTVVSAMRWAEWMLLTPSRMEDRLAVHRWSALLSRLERWREDENL